ncbi:hypothetical protein P280DRAFT_472771 [Massarina eburnea CBS 473.64]|uniref:Ig-like domain-containing protein n=1 Tax=Massarina eburnea CBS 473.64 TaxID=1395130 RepID=A0A6A6RSA4_9PLEO|nr:hypothetical protein P280DRAFT_472771 [Massarina eburnea CBS 473.64]
MRFLLLPLLVLALSFLGLTTPTDSTSPLTISNASATSYPSVPSSRPYFNSNGQVTAGLPGGVYVCEGDHWTGYCLWISPGDFRKGQGCLRLIVPAPEGPKVMKVRSLGPDAGGSCWMYGGQMCIPGEVVRWTRDPGIETGLEDFGALTCFPDGRGNAAAGKS